MRVLKQTELLEYDIDQIKTSLQKAFDESDNTVSPEIIKNLADEVTEKIKLLKLALVPRQTIIEVTEDVLMSNRFFRVASAYVKARYQRDLQRALQTTSGVKTVINKYLDKSSWEINENANVQYSLQGLNHTLVRTAIERYALELIYSDKVTDAYRSGYMHIHDLDSLSAYTYFGKESIIAKIDGCIKSLSFEQLYCFFSKHNEINPEIGIFTCKPKELQVLDKNGWTDVTKLTKKIKDKPMHFIKNRSGRSVIVTADHPMITDQGECIAQDVTKSQKLFTADIKKLLTKLEPGKLFCNNYIDLLRELKIRNITQLNEKDYLYFNGIKLSEIFTHKSLPTEDGIIHSYSHCLPRQIKLTEDLGYFIGAVLAEGYLSYDRTGYRISISQNNSKWLLRINTALLQLGISGVLTESEHNKFPLECRNAILKVLFESIFCIIPGSKHKSLPQDFLTYNIECVRGIIAGIIDGDGCIDTAGTSIIIKTTSRTMLEQLATALHLLGLTARDRTIEGIGSERTFKNRVIVQKLPLYGITFRKQKSVLLPSDKYNAANYSTKAWQDETVDDWHAITNTKITEIQEDYIYDITTKTHTLLVNGMYNHNCVGWDIQDLLEQGFGGVPGKVHSAPAKHFRTALGQVVNFIFTLQNECYSDDTEVLTSRGWKLFSELVATDPVATLNIKTKEMEFLVPTHYIQKSVNTELLQFKSERLDLLVTPKHNMLVEQYDPRVQCGQGKLKLVTAQNFNPNTNFIPKNVKWAGTPVKYFVLPKYTYQAHSGILEKYTEKTLPEVKIPMDLWLPFLGIYLSEGTCWRRTGMDKRRAISRNEHGVCISQTKFTSEFRTILTEISKYLGCNFSETIRSNGNVQFRCTSIRLYNYLKQFGLSKDKYLPDYVKQLPVGQLELFYKYIRIGNGSTNAGATQENYFTASKRLANDMQELFVKLGTHANILTKHKIVHNKTHTWYVVSRQFSAVNKLKSTQITRVPYTGNVYCVSTKNQTLLVRRNGKASWCGNCAGAQAFSNFDTYLAPFISFDKLTYKETKQAMQEFVFNMNVATRSGAQSPFSNVTLDLTIPKHLSKQPVIIGGKLQNETYGEFQKEMDMFNRAFFEVMMEGDATGRVFTFPIPTINVDKSFEWENPNFKILWEITAKYGIAYFANYINSDMSPEDSRSMCCRLRLNLKELHKRSGGLFGSGSLTGSIGVVTLSLPRIAHDANGSADKFYTLLSKYMELGKQSLEAKRMLIEQYTDRGLYPYSKHYLSKIKEKDKSYWANHFSTIGIIGMYEAVTMLGMDYITPEGKKFAMHVLDFMNNKLVEFQKDTGNFYNLEATPAEGASYKLALLAKKTAPKVLTSGTTIPYFTNSTMLPVQYSSDIFKVLEHQDSLQERYTGGTTLHIYTGEKLEANQVKNLVRKVLTNYKLPYISITPTFSICPTHGYMAGEHATCPICQTEKQALEDKIKILKSQVLE